LHIMLEEILVGSIAAATVTEPQDRGRLGITALSNTVPIRLSGNLRYPLVY
jgi:hypothetical protein